MEIYIYRDDGTLTVLSGNRRFEDRFSVSQEPNEQGLYKLDGVTRFNTEGVDCTGGSQNYVGKPYTFYLKFDASFREMWVYYDLDGGSGFGPLFRVSN